MFLHIILDTTSCSFFFSRTFSSSILTLSLHDALPISQVFMVGNDTGDVAEQLIGMPAVQDVRQAVGGVAGQQDILDRKSTRLNSSHVATSYAVFCLKKKKYSCYENNTLSMIIPELLTN